MDFIYIKVGTGSKKIMKNFYFGSSDNTHFYGVLEESVEILSLQNNSNSMIVNCSIKDIKNIKSNNKINPIFIILYNNNIKENLIELAKKRNMSEMEINRRLRENIKDFKYYLENLHLPQHILINTSIDNYQNTFSYVGKRVCEFLNLDRENYVDSV